jgi:hypothetical protein
VTDLPYPVVTGARHVPTALHLNRTNAAYLGTKARRGGHDLLAQSLDLIETESAR